jgi:hypothetical protein
MPFDEMTGEEMTGDDYTSGEENVVGALAAQFRRKGFAPRQATAMARASATSALPSRLPPAPSSQVMPARIMAYCGLGSVEWTGADSADKTLEVEPQSTFLGERLVITARYSSGAGSRLVVINRPLTVGGLPQTPAPDQVAPIEMFQADVTYSRLNLKPAMAGTKISIGFAIDAAPSSGESVILSAGLYGEWVQ